MGIHVILEMGGTENFCPSNLQTKYSGITVIFSYTVILHIY